MAVCIAHRLGFSLLGWINVLCVSTLPYIAQSLEHSGEQCKGAVISVKKRYDLGEVGIALTTRGT